MKTCRFCGAPLDEDALYCANCGCDVKAQGMSCPQCGAPLDEGALYCANCGCDVKAQGMSCHQCGTELDENAFNANCDVRPDMPQDSVPIYKVEKKRDLRWLFLLVGILIGILIFFRRDLVDLFHKPKAKQSVVIRTEEDKNVSLTDKNMNGDSRFPTKEKPRSTEKKRQENDGIIEDEENMYNGDFVSYDKVNEALGESQSFEENQHVIPSSEAIPLPVDETSPSLTPLSEPKSVIPEDE